MTNHNPQKYKEIRVPQEFFNQILIGFKNAEQQVNTKAKMPQYVPFHQSYFFRNRTLPIILKSADKSNLMYDWVSTTLERIKQQQQLALKRKFLKASNVADQMQEQLQETIEQQQNQKDGAFKGIRNALKMYDKVTSMIWTFRKGKVLYEVLRQGVEKKQLQGNTTTVSDSSINRQINKTMDDSKNTVLTTVQSSTYPAIHMFSTKMYDLTGNILSKFWDSFVDNILLPNSWQDAGWWALAVAKGMYVGISSGYAGIITGPAAFVDARIGFKKSARQFKKAAELQGTSSTLMYGEAVANTMVTLFSSGKLAKSMSWMRWTVRGAHAASLTLKGLRGYAWFSDLYQVSDADVTKMKSDFTNLSSRWGRRVNSALAGVARTVGKFELGVQQKSEDIQDELIGQLDSIGTMNIIQKIYNTQISINGSKLIFVDNDNTRITLDTISESLINLGVRINDKMTNQFINLINENIRKELFNPLDSHNSLIKRQVQSLNELANLRKITIDGRQYTLQSKTTQVRRLVGNTGKLFDLPSNLNFHYSSGAIIKVGAKLPFSPMYKRILQNEQFERRREANRRSNAAIPIVVQRSPDYIQASMSGVFHMPVIRGTQFQRIRSQAGHDTTGFATHAPTQLRTSRGNELYPVNLSNVTYQHLDGTIQKVTKIKKIQNSNGIVQLTGGSDNNGLDMNINTMSLFKFDDNNYIWDIQLQLKDQQNKLLLRQNQYNNKLGNIINTLNKKFKKQQRT